MKHLSGYIFTLLFLSVNTLLAQTFVTKVSSKTIGKKDLLEVQYIAENLELSDFILPRFTSWSVQAGPEFRSNRVQSGNVVKQQIIYTLLLQPLRTGKLSVPSAKIIIDRNTTRQSNTITVDVKPTDHIAGNIQGVTTSRQPLTDPQPDDFVKDQLIKRGENIAAKIKGNLLINLTVNKSASYVGEPILATYKLATRLRSQSRVVKQPAFSGATVVEMTPEETVPKQERINGKMYNVYVIRKVQLYPLQQGKFVLPQATVENKVTFYNAENLNYRDIYYNPQTLPSQEQTVTIANNTATVDVKPLPANAPPGFNGAVGKFKIDVSTSGDKPITTNNTAAFIVVVEGPGNLQQIKAPVVNWPNGIEAFDVTDQEEIDKEAFPAKVRKTFTYPFLVSKVGKYTIPPVEFSYFDPYQEKYITLTTAPFSFTAAAGQKPDVSKFSFKENFGFETYLAVLIGGGLLAIFVGLVIYSRNQGRKAATKKPVPANVVVQNNINRMDALQFLNYIHHSNPIEEGPTFYKHLHRHITSYLKAKFDMSDEDIDAIATTHPNEETFSSIKYLLDECKLAMYTPIYNVEEAMQHRVQALNLLSRFEKVD